eukprot:jgi/Tetstr1/447193/TSEL_034630.t1
MEKLSQLSKVSDAMKSTKELEKNYISHLFTFMAMSKKLEETTNVLDAVSKSLDNINIGDIEEVQKSKARIHKSISMVRNEFLSQVNAMMKNPNYGEDLKNKLANLVTEFKNIDQHTKPKGIFGGGSPNGHKAPKATKAPKALGNQIASKNPKHPKHPKLPKHSKKPVKRIAGGSVLVAKAYSE